MLKHLKEWGWCIETWKFQKTRPDPTNYKLITKLNGHVSESFLLSYAQFYVT